MNNWLSLVPARVRTTLYLIVGGATIVLTAGATYFTTIGADVPVWIVGAGGVVAYLAGIFNLVAAGNTSVGNKNDALDLDHDDVEVQDPDTGETETVVGKLGQ